MRRRKLGFVKIPCLYQCVNLTLWSYYRPVISELLLSYTESCESSLLVFCAHLNKESIYHILLLAETF